VCLTTKV